jgi:glycosyltransferase involved in cell wall biosynthesis
MGVSVIICCYNSANKIKNVLKHLEEQKGTELIPWEVIVVDNASIDDTSEVAMRSWTRKDVPFQVIHEAKPGLSNARLRGLDTSVHPIIVFVDDDNLVAEDYIARAFNLMEGNKKLGLAGGLGIPVSDTGFPEWFDQYQDAFAVGPQADKTGVISEERTYLHGAGLIMRKEVWQLIMESGFNFVLSGRKGKSMSSGEDSEISSAFRLAGYDLWYDPNLKFQHIIPVQRLNWKFLIKLSREFGKSFAVLDIYFSEIRDFTGWKKAKSHNWILGTAICVYQILKLLPAYTWIKLRNVEGARKDFQLTYQSGVFIQRFKLLGNFTSIKKEIIGFKKRVQQSN